VCGHSPGSRYILAGTVLAGSVKQEGTTLLFRVRDPKLDESVLVRYTGIVPDPFAPGRGVLVDVKEADAGDSATFVGEQNSLTTKCPRSTRRRRTATRTRRRSRDAEQLMIQDVSPWL